MQSQRNPQWSPSDGARNIQGENIYWFGDHNRYKADQCCLWTDSQIINMREVLFDCCDLVRCAQLNKTLGGNQKNLVKV